METTKHENRLNQIAMDFRVPLYQLFTVTMIHRVTVNLLLTRLLSASCSVRTFHSADADEGSGNTSADETTTESRNI